MPQRTIDFPEKAPAKSLGRNGTLDSVGVQLTYFPDHGHVSVEPVTTKHEIGRAKIAIHDWSLAEIIRTFAQFAALKLDQPAKQALALEVARILAVDMVPAPVYRAVCEADPAWLNEMNAYLEGARRRPELIDGEILGERAIAFGNGWSMTLRVVDGPVPTLDGALSHQGRHIAMLDTVDVRSIEGEHRIATREGIFIATLHRPPVPEADPEQDAPAP
jgi:hypothetical protein